MLTIRVSQDVATRLENLANMTGHTKTFHARKAILEYFGDLENFYLTQKHLNDTEASLVKPII